ncbi:MAG: LuxR C-terminal-related transcriptional regulator [Methylacidiphilales bacterium]|nr:LuxR C-terminal-related transcriptional regulator [Candidatus Methylacidiphilales bacterium]
MNTTSIAFPKAAAISFTHPAREEIGGAKQSPKVEVAQHKGGSITKTRPLICVVDLDYKLRRDVALLFQSEKSQVEYFASANWFLKRKVYDGPCCVVMDALVPGLSGPDLLQLIAKERRTEQIVLVSGLGDISICAMAFKAGAIDFLSKPLKEAELLLAIKNGLQRSEELLLWRQGEQIARDLLNQLTPREREVLGFVIAGRLNKVIAVELGTSEKTIKKHRGHIMKKLKVGSIAELVHFSLVYGLKPALPYETKVPYTDMK